MSVTQRIEGRTRDLGGFSVARVLPAGRQRQMVGPFIFFDHMGPTVLPPGQGVDVRPHPHIGLATVTWLFAGEIVHRDSLGFVQPIRPGDVNWMTAGRGIAHSERSGDEARAGAAPLHGIQSWVALPRAHEETEPSFAHHPAETLPRIERPGARLTVIAGEAFGERSPVAVLSPTLYVEARLDAGAVLALPPEHRERAVFVVEGAIDAGGGEVAAGTMAVLEPGGPVALAAREDTLAMIVGGAPVDGPRHIGWNFVSSRPERIERAKADWRERRFAAVPDDDERIELPEG